MKSRTRPTPARSGRLLAIAAVVALAVSACSSGGGGTAAKSPDSSGTIEKPDLSVTYGTNSASTLPLWIAADEGIFSKNGLNVKITQATSVSTSPIHAKTRLAFSRSARHSSISILLAIRPYPPTTGVGRNRPNSRGIASMRPCSP